MSEVEDRAKGGKLGLASRACYFFLQTVVRFAVAVYFRAWVHDAHKLPAEGPVILAPIHRSNLDVPLLGATCARRLRYFAKDSLFKNRFWTWLITLIGGFPVHRDAADRKALDAAQRILDRGEPLAMFPEGERKSGPVAKPFFDGVAYVAGRAQVPIVPVGIGGSQRAMPKGAWIPRPTKIVYLYGDPIDPPAKKGKRVPRDEIKRVTAQLYEQVQLLFDDAQARAGQPNPPRIANEST